MKWSEQYRLKEMVHQQYPTVWDLKIVRKRLPLILEHLRDGESVLEIGAFHREMESRLKSRYPGIRYRSMDIDPTFPHDYASMEAIRESFDMVLLFEVIEHLDLKEGGEMVHKIYEILNPGGRVILTTPNVYTPGQYWKDLTHRVAYHHEELGALLLGHGFELSGIFRLYSEPRVTYWVKVYLLSTLFRILGIDFTRSILLVARKGKPEVATLR